VVALVVGQGVQEQRLSELDGGCLTSHLNFVDVSAMTCTMLAKFD
jgi:hypothetical protein